MICSVLNAALSCTLSLLCDFFFLLLVIVYLYYMPPLPSFFVSIGCANARHRAPRSWMARLQHNFLNTVMNHSCIAQAESNNGFQRAAALFSCYTCRTLCLSILPRNLSKTICFLSARNLSKYVGNTDNSRDNLKAPLELYHHCFIQKKLHKHIHVHFYSFKIPPEVNFI